MTDRHAAYLVILKSDIREDDAEPIANALRMVKHVASVEPVIAEYDTNDQIIARRARDETRALLLRMLRDLDKPRDTDEHR